MQSVSFHVQAERHDIAKGVDLFATAVMISHPTPCSDIVSNFAHELDTPRSSRSDLVH